MLIIWKEPLLKSFQHPYVKHIHVTSKCRSVAECNANQIGEPDGNNHHDHHQANQKKCQPIPKRDLLLKSVDKLSKEVVIQPREDEDGHPVETEQPNQNDGRVGGVDVNSLEEEAYNMEEERLTVIIHWTAPPRIMKPINRI